MKPMNILSLKALQSLKSLPLPALILSVDNSHDLQAILNHCIPTQIVTIFNQDSLLFNGAKSQLSDLEFPYPIHIYLPDPVRESYRQLVDIVAQLRHPETGCPWDLAQTPTSLTPYIIEEAYEVVHAIESDKPAAIQEELGDLLLQVVLQAQIAQETGEFSVVEVAQAISEKLVRRHPHVFGELEVADVNTVRQNWEMIKQQEQGHSLAEKLDNYIATFPALIAAAKIYRKLPSQVIGFPIDPQAIQAQLTAFLDEPNAEHLGRLLFMLVALGTTYHLDANLALEAVNNSLLHLYQRAKITP